MASSPVPIPTLKQLLVSADPRFGEFLQVETQRTSCPAELMRLSNLRKMGASKSLESVARINEIRLSLIGGFTLYPLTEMVEHLFWSAGFKAIIEKGEFDNYIAETMDPKGRIYKSDPNFIVIVPNASRCTYLGNLSDPREKVQDSVEATVDSLLKLVEMANHHSKAPVILANFIPSCGFDLGQMRIKSLASEWSYRKHVNLELGLRAPSYVSICDLEFLSSRQGLLASQDPRGWYETKQICNPRLLVEIAKEIVHLAIASHRAAKKVLVLDADNTLWGGGIADDGIEGIELGDTSVVGQAFKSFQRYILGLKRRGVLLALCSKNEDSVVRKVFQKHPEMVLKESDFTAFKANWNPKPENIEQIGKELNLSLDSFVFVDDSPGEIEMVKQWIPEVTTHLLSLEPENYVFELQETRLFEIRMLTKEDEHRTELYRSMPEGYNKKHGSMEEYLDSLGMEAEISPFVSSDIPRITQLINKSNQFNLTTHRWSQAEVEKLLSSQSHITFSIRLRDRFVDHGLVSVLIGENLGEAIVIDTWLMSCRVLQRQIEALALNWLVVMAQQRACSFLKGVYIPTAKNELVANHYTKLGFELINEESTKKEYQLDIRKYEPTKTQIQQATRNV